MSDYIPKIMKEGAELTSPTLLASVILTNNTINQQENTRQSNEADRELSESQRESAETARIADELTRESNEDTRISDETIRQNYYNAYKVLQTYNSSTAYIVGNKVTYQGGSYQCITNTTGNFPTYNTDNTWWKCIAAKGTDGAGGDMFKETYDPNNKNTDAFNSANQVYNNTTSGLTSTNTKDAIDELKSQIGDLGDLETESNADLVESINEISVKVIKSVKDYGAKGDGVSDDTNAIQSAIDAISPYIWQGSAGSTTHAVKYGSLGFPKGVYRITSKLKINAGIKLVGVGIEKGSDWNTRETQSSCIFVDYDNESDFAFDTCPYNATGVRVNNYLGTGADVNDGLHSTCEGIEFHNMTFYTNKTVRGFNMALSPSFIMNNCFVKGFTLSIRFSATWYSSIINTTMISRWRGISATNSTNNLNLYNVGIAKAQDMPDYISTLNDGCEYDSGFKSSCGITGNWIGINAYGLTIEWFSEMVNLGNSTGELYGIWTEQITSTLIYSYYSNLDISFNNIHCQMADVLNVTDSNLRITSLSRDYNYSKITGWLEATDVPKVTLTGFKPKAADGAHMNDRELRSVFTDNLNNKSTKALIYVDSVDGNDINFGDTESRSLKTLKAAIKYSQELGKQVSILLKSGQTFDIDYTSISTNDLVISSFGSGSKPIINFSYEYSGISFNISKASITFKNLTINNYGAKNDGYRGIASMSVRGVLNVEFIDCFINLATNSHVVGAQANGSYLANIIYENCTIDGYGTTKTYGRLSYDIYRDAGDINAWNDIAINEYAFHTTKNALILGYGVANIMQKLHSTLDP